MSNSNLQKNKINLQNILNTINDLPEASSGVELPTLNNEAAAAELLIGKELIDQDGAIITGTMPDNGAVNITIDGVDTKSATIAAGYTAGGTVSLDDTIDTEVSEQADLIAQIMEVVNSLPEAGGGGGVNKLAGVVDGTLTEITTEDLAGATQIQQYFFYNNYKLESIAIPQSVETIGANAFYNNIALKNVVISDGVVNIWSSAFEKCTSLTSITIPDSVKDIGARVCHSCSNLTSAVIGNGVTITGYYGFYGCKILKSVVIGNSVTIISEGTFNTCTGLTSVEIPDNVTTIGVQAFYNCTFLKRVDFSKHTAIPSLSNVNALQATHKYLQIKVPANLYEEWKSATNWAAYADQIVTEFTNEI